MSGAETAGYNTGFALGGMLANGLVVVALGALLVLIVFIVLREFWTWYWKQSEQTELLKSIARSVQLLEERGRPAGAPAPHDDLATRLAAKRARRAA